MDFFAHHILSVVLFTPLAGALLMLFIPRENELAHKIAGNIFGVFGFLVSLPLVRWFKPEWGGFTFQETADWIPSIGAKYHLGLDGISLLLVMLTTFLGMIAILSSWSDIHQRERSILARSRMTNASLRMERNLGAFDRLAPLRRDLARHALGRALPCSDPHLRLPRAIAYSDHHRTLVLEPVPGRDLTLTLDMELMRSIDRAFERYQRNRAGAAVVVEVSTGRVLAPSKALGTPRSSRMWMPSSDSATGAPVTEMSSATGPRAAMTASTF